MLRALFTVASKLYQCHSTTISISQRTLRSSIQAIQPLHHIHKINNHKTTSPRIYNDTSTNTTSFDFGTLEISRSAPSKHPTLRGYIILYSGNIAIIPTIHYIASYPPPQNVYLITKESQCCALFSQ
jgi:hypothetical protein